MSIEAGPTHYETLGVAPDATQDEIKKAYRALIRQVHPDVAGPEGALRSAEISAAYEILSRPEKRADYDYDLADGNAGSSEEQPFADSWGNEDSWDEPAGAGLDEEVIDAEVQEDEFDDWPSQQNRTPDDQVQYDPPPVAQPVPNAPVQPSPAAPPAQTETVFVPPLHPPAPVQRKTPRWIVVWMIGFSIPAILTIGFVLLGLAAEAIGGQRSSGPGLLIFLIILWAAVVAGPMTLRRLTAPKPVQPEQPATALLPEGILLQQVHGVRALAGVEEWRRTDLLLRTSVLPSYPAMRLLHGIQVPGIDPDVVDHVLVVGRTVIVIDSAFWQDGFYWWDGSTLARDNRRLQPFRLGAAVERMRHGLPGVRVIGAVVLQSPDGRLDHPVIENAPNNGLPLGQQYVTVLNSAGLIGFVRGITDGLPDRDVVDVQLLKHLLQFVR